MRADEVFQKTASGQYEVNEKSAGLSMRERRVLILLNGQRTLGQVQQMSLVETIEAVIDKLLDLDLIEPLRANSRRTPTSNVSLAEPATKTAPQRAVEPPIQTPRQANAPTPVDVPVASSGPITAQAQTFMRNSLLRFANRVRVSKLVSSIDSAANSAELKPLIKPWYDAIAESPTGIYEVDDLKASLLEMLLAEEV
ncbi:MAG: hypothetical protein AAF434_15700 [Pseudomonadota bacterium]